MYYTYIYIYIHNVILIIEANHFKCKTNTSLTIKPKLNLYETADIIKPELLCWYASGLTYISVYTTDINSVYKSNFSIMSIGQIFTNETALNNETIISTN